MKMLIKVESVADFASAWGLESNAIEGFPLAPVRRAKIAGDTNAELWAIERHGYRAFDLPEFSSSLGIASLKHLEAFRTRRRDFQDDADGYAHAGRLIDSAITELGSEFTCDLFFAAEREYWQRRNRAAQFQKSRQDRLGLGWGQSRSSYVSLVARKFSAIDRAAGEMGFVCRERFYAGADAGWGAQVIEQPTAGVIVFADVDLSPEELFQDFSHDPLPVRKELGTVGLWCALHGEAFLQAGMHHLECQFDFEALSRQMETGAGIRVMKPFTDFPYLRQAFTEGERWPVREERIARLLTDNKITAEQAAKFREQGAIGSHLENLERNEGFKGFNQKGVSDIIARTDPRRQA